MADLAVLIAGLARRIGELERRGRGHAMEGRVSDADPAKGLYRVDFGDGFKSGWLPVRSPSAGALKIQAEPTVGEMVMVRSESGDLTDGVIEGSGFTDDRPHDQNGEFFLSRGAAEVLVTADRILLTVGASSVAITTAGVAIDSPSLTHNDSNVGDTHVHGGVESGGSTTSTPN